MQSTDGNTPVTIEGGGATDTIVGPNTTDSWSITGTQQGDARLQRRILHQCRALDRRHGRRHVLVRRRRGHPQVNGGGRRWTRFSAPTSALSGRSRPWTAATSSGSSRSGDYLRRTVELLLRREPDGRHDHRRVPARNGKGVTGTHRRRRRDCGPLELRAVHDRVTANLATGVATRVANGVIRIENVTGGTGDDHLDRRQCQQLPPRRAGGNDILLGGGGIDTLWGLAGRDILIGGTRCGQARRRGAATTSSSTGQPTSTPMPWPSPRCGPRGLRNLNYNQRIQNLNSTLTPTTVHHDASADTSDRQSRTRLVLGRQPRHHRRGRVRARQGAGQLEAPTAGPKLGPAA